MKKKSFLLFKNAFKQAFRNKIQLVGLIFLILLSSTIFSLMQTSLARISNEYKILITKSNLHDFIIDLSNTTRKQFNSTKIIKSQNGIIENNDLIINNIANNDEDNKFIWDRVEGRTMQLDNNNDSKILKILVYNQDSRIDKLIIIDGYKLGDINNPDKKTPIWKQVIINKEFAQKNHLNINDIIRVQSDQLGNSLKVFGYDLNDPVYSNYNWLKIVGFGISSDFTTPIIDQTSPIPNKNRECLLYVDPVQFGLRKKLENNNYIWSYNKSNEKITISSDNDREIYFVGKWKNNQRKNIELISKKLKNYFINTIDVGASLIYKLGDSNYKFNNRTATLNSTINGFTILLIGLLLIVLTITGITVILITYKNIDNSKIQIGILKSLGYSNIKILITSLAYPMVAAFIGTFLVFLPASGLQIVIVNIFANYFNLEFGNFIFNSLGFIYCLILIFGFLSIIAWFISALTVIKNPIDLIKNESSTFNFFLSRIIKIKTLNYSFLTRFRLSLFTSSIGKMSTAALTMFLGTTLMTTAIIGPKIMSDNKLLSFTGMNYNSLVEYIIPTYNSPYTFYKTYNLNNKDDWTYISTTDGTDIYWHSPRFNNYGALDNNYVKELLENDINAEAYSPMSSDSNPNSAISSLGLNSLTYLNGKLLTKKFLNGLDSSNIKDSSFIIEMIVKMAWPNALPMYDSVLKISNINNFYSDNTYNIIKKFYQNYRNTIVMNINSIFSKNGNISNDPDDLDITKFKFWASNNINCYNNISINNISFINDIDNLIFDTSDKSHPFHLNNEKQLLNNNPNNINKNERDSWINKVAIWFSLLFYNRMGQTVVQGAYTKSPYFIRQNIIKAYMDDNSYFNVSFNVIPYDKNTDELGTYFIGTPKKLFKQNKYLIKVYGLQSEKELGKPSMMQLYDSEYHSLNNLLEQKNNNKTINIVINQTISKQLNLKVNDEFKMSSNINIMKFKNNISNEFESFDLNKINIDNIVNDVKIINNVTLLKQKTSYTQVENLKNGAYLNAGINATDMLKEVSAGKIVNSYNDKINFKYKIVGIYNGYGQPNAYISKSNADKILLFNKTKEFLFLLFKKEWEDKNIILGVDFSKLKLIDNYNVFINKLNNPNYFKLNQIFENENPIFNFKFSNSKSLPDITNSFSTSQMYGDYSSFGLNGGNYLGIDYQGYGSGSALNIFPQKIHYKLLNQITALVDILLFSFIFFSLIISFFIILLTSNLVIYENRKIIATMKTLGYSDLKITNIVIGMYLPVIVFMFIIGFPVGWIIVKLIINYLSTNTIWVLPLFFVWWLVILVGIIVFFIYVLTFIIDWFAMKKINPIKILNEID